LLLLLMLLVLGAVGGGIGLVSSSSILFKITSWFPLQQPQFLIDDKGHLFNNAVIDEWVMLVPS